MSPKLPRMTALEAERLLLKNGFELCRSKGSHRQYRKGTRRITLAFHAGKDIHPKAVKEVLEAIEQEL